MPNENYPNICQDLCRLLADTYTLYLKTQYFHWNVTGELFFTLHAAFEKQYEELAEAVDEIAERIRTLNAFSPGTFQQFQELTGIESNTEVPPAQTMVRELLAGHQFIIKELDEMIKKAEGEGDQVTMDFLIERQGSHQKTAWMLQSCLQG